MIHPDSNRFRELALQSPRVVVYQEIAGDLVTPVLMLQHFSNRENMFLLESANLDKSFSRYTFFGVNPLEVIRYQGGILTVERNGASEVIDQNPVAFLQEKIAAEGSWKDESLGGFAGGYVGFMGYDMDNYMGNLRKPLREEADDPVMAFLKVDEFYVFDNHRGKLYAAISVEGGGDPRDAYARAQSRLGEMALEIIGVNSLPGISGESGGQYVDFRESEFADTVTKLRREIENGECIQVVLSNRYRINAPVDAVNLYRVVRNLNPSPYMFFLKFAGDILLGTSPEVHLKVIEGKATLKPIAGTYRFDGGDVEKIKASLLADPKERSEHLMLLDLARNDLYTGCKFETVKVTESFVAEVYSHVVHIVSEVEGVLSDDVTPFKLFCNTFPAGTVSGAPKVRAMELIDQYEVSPRGFYAGCAGYFSYSQDVDTCIIIRSAFVKKESVTFRAGAGIVHDSIPENEYREVENKLGALFAAMKKIGTVEKKNVFDD